MDPAPGRGLNTDKTLTGPVWAPLILPVLFHSSDCNPGAPISLRQLTGSLLGQKQVSPFPSSVLQDDQHIT